MEAFIIRKAVFADLESIERLVQKGVEEGVLLGRSKAELEQVLSNFFVATIQNRIIGCVSLEQYTKRIAELRSIYVEKKYRNRGVAKTLIQKALDRAKTLGIREVITISDKEWVFRSCGFKDKIGKQKALLIRF